MKIRELLTVFGIKTDQKKLDKFGASVDGAKSKLKSMAAAAVTAFAALVSAQQAVNFVKFFNETAKAAEEVALLADALGVARDTFQEVDAAVKVLGGDTNDTSDLFTTLNDRAQDAAGGLQSMADDFKLIGINAKDLKGLKVEQVFDLVAQKARETQDESKVAAFAVRTLGDDLGRKLLPALRDGATSFDELRRQAREAGLVFDNQQIEAFRRYRETLRSLDLTMQGIKGTIAVAFVPFFQKATTEVETFVRSNREFIALKLRDVIDFIARRVEVLRRVFNELNDGFERLSGSRILLTLGTILALILALVTPVGQVALLVGFLEDLFVSMNNGEGVIAKFARKFPIVQRALESFRSAVEELQVSVGMIRENFRDFVTENEALRKIVTIAAASLIAVLGKAISVVTRIFARLAKRYAEFQRFLSKFPEFSEAVDLVSEAFKFLQGQLNEAFDILDLAFVQIGEGDESFKELAATVISKVVKAFAFFVIALGEGAKIIANLIFLATQMKLVYNEAIDFLSDKFTEWFGGILLMIDEIFAKLAEMPRRAKDAAAQLVTSLPGGEQALNLAASAADFVGAGNLFGGAGTTNNTRNTTTVRVENLRVESPNASEAGRNVANTLEDQLRFGRESFGGAR